MPRSRARRIRNRDGVVLAVGTAVLLLAGEVTNPVLRTLLVEYVAAQPNPLLAAGAIVLVFIAYTPAFGSLLALIAAVMFARDEVPRGRFFLGLGIGLSLLGLLSKISLAVLTENAGIIAWLATTATGLGVLFGVSAQIVMGSHVMALKKRRRKLRKLRERHAAMAAKGAGRGSGKGEAPSSKERANRQARLPDH